MRGGQNDRQHDYPTTLRVETSCSDVIIRILAAKTRVCPVGGMTIPRLELLSALLLSNLISNVQSSLQSELSLTDPICYSDSKVALYWIYGQDQD